MTISEKVAYATGLMAGLGFDKESKEGKVLETILDVLKDIAGEMSDLREALEELEDYAEALDDDVNELEKLLDLDDDEDEDDDALIEIECKNCGHVNTIDPVTIWESEEEVEVFCSQCNALIFSAPAFGDSDDEDDDDEDDEDYED
jgi:predicted nuclease with TOPRIM domain